MGRRIRCSTPIDVTHCTLILNPQLTGRCSAGLCSKARVRSLRAATDGTGLKPGDFRLAGIPFCHSFYLVERMCHSVPPKVLHQRQPCGVHHVHNRRRTELGGREQYPSGHEKRQRRRQPSHMFMNSPNGRKGGIQITPLSGVAAKDEFLNIKKVSRNDTMAAHHVPPQMMGIMPSNVGRFGHMEKVSKVFVRNELVPLQKRLKELNEWINEAIINLTDYQL